MSKNVVLVKPPAKRSGGLEKTAAQIGDAFARRGHTVSWLSPDFPSWLPTFVRLEQFDRSVQSWVKNHTPDIVFGFDRTRKQTHLRAGNGVHAAYLETRGFWKQVSARINPLHRKILSIEKQAFEDPDLQKIFVNSHMVKNQIAERFSMNPDKIQVIHNGVAWGGMQTQFDLWPQVKKHNVLELLFIGHGFQRKGLDLLLNALRALKPKHMHLSVVGHDKHLDRYRAQNQDLPVTFFGPRADVHTFYQQADALIIPSFYDPFANVTVEALAMGLYVISSKHNGGHEILTPDTGLITDLSVDALVHALEHVQPKTVERARAIRNSVRHLEIENQTDQLVEACGG